MLVISSFMDANELITYCEAEDRVCPQPVSWNQLWTILGAPQGILAAPLILAGWVYSNDEQKRLRLVEHIRFAEQQGNLARASAFLRSLRESEWHHLKK
jgi:hypothetical protein